ncbi:ankyrin domain-containing protein, partial [Pelagophyceae sp. CCMP2097]
QLAADGNIDELRILVENGMDPNNGDYDRRRALHLAACERRLGIVEYLLALPGVDVNVIDRFGGTPLEDAIREGHTSVAMLLERHGA